MVFRIFSVSSGFSVFRDFSVFSGFRVFRVSRVFGVQGLGLKVLGFCQKR